MNTRAEFRIIRPNDSRAQENAYKFYADRLRRGFKAKPPYQNRRKQSWVVEWHFPEVDDSQASG